MLISFHRFVSWTIWLIFPFIPPLLTPGNLLWDRLHSMCGSGPSICCSDANSRPLLLHVPLLWQLRWWDAPTPEEERRLPAWPAGNAALLYLTGHHVSMTCALTQHIMEIMEICLQAYMYSIFRCRNAYSVYAFVYIFMQLLYISFTWVFVAH